ncbi:tetratricopeptide repeat-containing sulfotransferase family protein [Citreimonas salinaria]|uniref:Tetratricopeptide repeat-containing protein n=1 Tax=Citreimonas salinaria TaxID=321339 RepID=A0A1H3HP67_9RHOB|nr:sulfotransferase [Citreimonas salinaria]SDY16588.1 Tetratricopeptide repeat-containing protein [Citreimonas salinaria]
MPADSTNGTRPIDRNGTIAQARALQAQGRLDEAAQAWRALRDANPGFAEARIHLSTNAFDQGDRDACLSELREVTRLLPDDPRAWSTLAARLRHFGLTDEALSACDAAIACDPKSVKLRAEKAHLQQSLGEFDAAERALIKLLRRSPADTDLYRMLMTAHRVTRNDPVLRQMLALWKDKRLNDTGRMNLGFALATAMEQLDEPRRVFAYLDAANAAQARLAPDDSEARAQQAAATLAAQEGADLTPRGPRMQPRPVFIVGMPRSGTTLVERIIARHSGATAGGEMGHALRRARLRFGPPEAMTPLADIPDDALVDWAADWARLATRDTGAASGVVTDKAMMTEQILGLIRRGMPGARIIVVHRDPRDIALSIYRNQFRLGQHRYANALTDIADAIKAFRAAIAHWRARMPEALHEIRYEDLVADPEAQTRALVAAAGLEWEDACLDPAAGSGSVRTLSVAQVRQPIHAGRRQAWRKYESEMQPFIDAWGDQPWD